jgi:hypothetical protein
LLAVDRMLSLSFFRFWLNPSATTCSGRTRTSLRAHRCTLEVGNDAAPSASPCPVFHEIPPVGLHGAAIALSRRQSRRCIPRRRWRWRCPLSRRKEASDEVHKVRLLGAITAVTLCGIASSIGPASAGHVAVGAAAGAATHAAAAAADAGAAAHAAAGASAAAAAANVAVATAVVRNNAAANTTVINAATATGVTPNIAVATTVVVNNAAATTNMTNTATATTAAAAAL